MARLLISNTASLTLSPPAPSLTCSTQPPARAHIAGDSIFLPASQRPNGGDTCRSHHEPIAINQAIRETDEDDEVDMPIDEKPALPRTRNRPKREV
ncbi:unnamed protein product [Prunus armeniaca]